MAKIKVIHKNKQLIVKSRLGKYERLNERELGIFHSKLIRGLMRPCEWNKKQISYVGPEGISLKKYLHAGVSKNDFFMVLAQVVEVTKKLEWYSLDINNIVLDMDYVFINHYTKEIHFIYQPVIGGRNLSNIFSFLYDIIFSAQFSINEDRNFTEDLVNTLNYMQFYSPDELEKYILSVYPAVYKQVQRCKQGQSQSLKNSRWDTGDVYTYKNEEPDEEGTLVLQQRGRMGNDDFGEETTVLGTGYEEPGTTLLNEEQVTYPYLIRQKGEERIEIDRTLFRLGKENGKADYVIDNSVISRIHAEIITEGDKYYLVDKRSTNKTFLNGTALQPEEKKELFDGDTIVLANEVFEFYEG